MIRSYDVEFITGENIGEEVVFGSHFLGNLFGGVGVNVDWAAEAALDFAETRHQLLYSDCADDHGVYIALGVLAAFCD